MSAESVPRAPDLGEPSLGQHGSSKLKSNGPCYNRKAEGISDMMLTEILRNPSRNIT